MENAENRRETNHCGPRQALRVLIVDGDSAARQALGSLATHWGDEVVAASDGRDGLARVRQHRPEIVILDRSLPDMAGSYLAKAIRSDAEGYRPYIFLVTALGDEEQLAQALAAGVDDFVTKPIGPAAALARLATGRRIALLQSEGERYRRQLQQQGEALARADERLRQWAETDGVTGLLNRRAAMARFEKVWSAAAGDGRPLSCLLIDLDGFKKINEQHGPEGADDVLKAVAAVIRRAVRSEDIPCRLGGDQFLVICPGLDLAGAEARGARLVDLVGALGIRAGGLRFGLSIGVAERRPDIETPLELLRLADEGMCRAKFNGRNRVVSGHGGASGMAAARAGSHRRYL